MRSTTAPQPGTTPLPGHLSAPECTAFLFPPLSMPQRGPKGTRGSYRVFPLILSGLYTGMQWQCLPGPIGPPGQPALPSTTLDKVLAKWADDGARWQAFIASVRHLAAAKPRDTSVLHGDGTNTVAHKGARASAPPARSPRRGRQSSRASPTMVPSERLSPWPLSMQRRGCVFLRGCTP
jgi:hypothetical protein